MIRRLTRSALLVAGFSAVLLPSRATAQDVKYSFSSCSTPGVCGWVQAFFTGSLLSVRISNGDYTVGSALYTTQIVFASALAAANPGEAFSAATTATPSWGVTSIGATSANGWSFGAVGGSTILDLSSFLGVYIEGTAASPGRDPNNPDGGTWVTAKGSFVEFTSDLSGIAGVNTGQIVGLGFCTDVNCALGNAVVTTTPEPATLTLLATGMAGVAALRRRRKKAA